MTGDSGAAMGDRILMVENSSERGSVAVGTRSSMQFAVNFMARDPATGAQTEGTARAIEQCLGAVGLQAADLEAIVCGAGPGGFTSLRCAAAIAKGMCSVLAIPLYAVSSLELLAYSTDLADGAYVGAMPAGRGEWFSIPFEVSDGERALGALTLLSMDDLDTAVSAGGMGSVGPGLRQHAYPDAAGAWQFGMDRIARAGPVSLDRWEPVYGRLAEAQVRWEREHGRPLPA